MRLGTPLCSNFSCLTEKISDKTESEEISFGSGNRFTGELKIYTFAADSKLLEKGKEHKKTDKKITSDIFNMAKELKNYSFNEPDNMYSFVEIKTKEKTNRIVWGFGSANIDTTIIQLQSKLISLIK